MRFRRCVAVASLAAALISPLPTEAAANRASATARPAMSDGRSGGPGGMSEAEMQGAGCLASGTVATLAAYATNADEVVMLVAGGVFAPSTPTLLGIVMLSTVFTSGCAVGAIAAPFAYWLYRQAAPQVETAEPAAAAPP